MIQHIVPSPNPSCFESLQSPLFVPQLTELAPDLQNAADTTEAAAPSPQEQEDVQTIRTPLNEDDAQYFSRFGEKKESICAQLRHDYAVIMQRPKRYESIKKLFETLVEKVPAYENLSVISLTGALKTVKCDKTFGILVQQARSEPLSEEDRTLLAQFGTKRTDCLNMVRRDYDYIKLGEVKYGSRVKLLAKLVAHVRAYKRVRPKQFSDAVSNVQGKKKAEAEQINAPVNKDGYTVNAFATSLGKRGRVDTSLSQPSKRVHTGTTPAASPKPFHESASASDAPAELTRFYAHVAPQAAEERADSYVSLLLNGGEEPLSHQERVQNPLEGGEESLFAERFTGAKDPKNNDPFSWNSVWAGSVQRVSPEVRALFPTHWPPASVSNLSIVGSQPLETPIAVPAMVQNNTLDILRVAPASLPLHDRTYFESFGEPLSSLHATVMRDWPRLRLRLRFREAAKRRQHTSGVKDLHEQLCQYTNAYFGSPYETFKRTVSYCAKAEREGRKLDDSW